jgi:hypothetical protein
MNQPFRLGHWLGSLLSATRAAGRGFVNGFRAAQQPQQLDRRRRGERSGVSMAGPQTSGDCRLRRRLLPPTGAAVGRL